jgi:uncharacterized protein (DUF1778 family)
MQATENITQNTARLNIRLPLHVKERIEQAAIISGVSLTDFTITNLCESADEILEQHHFRTLSNRDRDIFLAMLDADDEPNEKLKDAFKARKELIAK